MIIDALRSKYPLPDWLNGDYGILVLDYVVENVKRWQKLSRAIPALPISCAAENGARIYIKM
ncbi:hypothetical protein [Eubacterium sp. An11]|uniref:hypothetical protein n=1 Tax=Eubacterium sp. An11 TaxID=1965542 RepID=UPI0013A6296F|nr:hypothetical protein [Eubacterium sp. An11]